jgi:transposase InsO family protein
MRDQQSNFRIEKMAEILQVSRSGYYQFLQRPKRAIDEDFLTKIKTIFHENKGRYGAPRIHAELKKQNIKSSRYQVEKLMRMNNLSSDRKKKRVKTTIPLKNGKDLIKRDFTAEKPNQKWCSDISYLPTRNGFVYLAVILDLYSRKVVGACVLEHMEQSLILQALNQAMSRYGSEKGMIFHSDRGGQYYAAAVEDLLKKYAVHMSKGKVCYDNAVMESFFSTLKKELMRDKNQFEDLQEAQLEVFEYVEIYYNKKRAHSTLGYKSPYEYEEEMKRLAE